MGRLSNNNDKEYITYIDKVGVTRRKYIAYCKQCGDKRYTSLGRLTQQRYCRKCASKLPMSEEAKKKISFTLREKYKTDGDFKRRVALARVVKRGEEHWNWKGGITPLTQRTRTSEDANAWKLAVLHRDNYACRICNRKENLHAHHINSWAEFPEDRFILENGLTLCDICHINYHHYEREVKKNAQLFK